MPRVTVCILLLLVFLFVESIHSSVTRIYFYFSEVALKNYSRSRSKMDLVVNDLYYRILDPDLVLSSYNAIRATIEDTLLILTLKHGFQGAFPRFEDPLDFQYLNSPVVTPDEGHEADLNGMYSFYHGVYSTLEFHSQILI
jgi:hypothetical protein